MVYYYQLTLYHLTYSNVSTYIIDSGQIQALVGNDVPLIMYGVGFTNDTEVSFTTASQKAGQECGKSEDSHTINTGNYKVNWISEDGKEAHLTVPYSALT